MDGDERVRHEDLLKEQTTLQRALENSRERVGVNPDDLQRVAAAALSRVGFEPGGRPWSFCGQRRDVPP